MNALLNDLNIKLQASSSGSSSYESSPSPNSIPMSDASPIARQQSSSQNDIDNEDDEDSSSPNPWRKPSFTGYSSDGPHTKHLQHQHHAKHPSNTSSSSSSSSSTMSPHSPSVSMVNGNAPIIMPPIQESTDTEHNDQDPEEGHRNIPLKVNMNSPIINNNNKQKNTPHPQYSHNNSNRKSNKSILSIPQSTTSEVTTNSLTKTPIPKPVPIQTTAINHEHNDHLDSDTDTDSSFDNFTFIHPPDVIKPVNNANNNIINNNPGNNLLNKPSATSSTTTPRSLVTAPSPSEDRMPSKTPKMPKTLKSQHTFYTVESSLIDHEDDYDPPRPSLHLSAFSSSNPVPTQNKYVQQRHGNDGTFYHHQYIHHHNQYSQHHRNSNDLSFNLFANHTSNHKPVKSPLSAESPLEVPMGQIVCTVVEEDNDDESGLMEPIELDLGYHSDGICDGYLIRNRSRSLSVCDIEPLEIRPRPSVNLIHPQIVNPHSHHHHHNNQHLHHHHRRHHTKQFHKNSGSAQQRQRQRQINSIPNLSQSEIYHRGRNRSRDRSIKNNMKRSRSRTTTKFHMKKPSPLTPVSKSNHILDRPRNHNIRYSHQQKQQQSQTKTFKSEFFRNEMNKKYEGSNTKDGDITTTTLTPERPKQIRPKLSLHNYSSTDTDGSLIQIKPSPKLSMTPLPTPTKLKFNTNTNTKNNKNNTKQPRDVRIIRRPTSEHSKSENYGSNASLTMDHCSSFDALQLPQRQQIPNMQQQRYNNKSPSLSPSFTKSLSKSVSKRRRNKYKLSKKSFTPSLTMLSEFTTLSNDQKKAMLSIPPECQQSDSCDMAYEEYIGTEYGTTCADSMSGITMSGDGDLYIFTDGDGDTETTYSQSNISIQSCYFNDLHDDDDNADIDDDEEEDQEEDEDGDDEQDEDEEEDDEDEEDEDEDGIEISFSETEMDLETKNESNPDKYDNDKWQQALQAAYERGFNKGYSMGVQFKIGQMPITHQHQRFLNK